MLLIIVNGQPATGKTTLSRHLAKETSVPLIAKDAIKEYLFDTIGYADREWSLMIGSQSTDFIWELADGVLGLGKSVMIENAFYASFASKHIDDLQKRYPDLRVVELYCEADPNILRKRFTERYTDGDRHPGHVDDFNDQQSISDAELARLYAPINPEKAVRINTNDPATIDYSSLVTLLEGK